MYRGKKIKRPTKKEIGKEEKTQHDHERNELQQTCKKKEREGVGSGDDVKKKCVQGKKKSSSQQRKK